MDDGFTEISEEFQPEPASLAMIGVGVLLLQHRRMRIKIPEKA
jgi:hypothetical protein